ncbi:MAG: hypothetical protein Kow0031_15640 [Anaerolineae bacterium]
MKNGSTKNGLDKPKLRNVNVQRITHQGQPVFLIQDGLRLTESAIVLPQALGPVAMLCDGQHTLPQMQATLEARYGISLTRPMLEDMVKQFDEALLLESDYFNQAKQQAVEQYRAAPHRKPALAGPSYPADPKRLRTLLRDYLDRLEDVPESSPDSRAVVSPHIDYPRGGHVYAAVWASAASAIAQAELIIILATDHNGGLGTITPTPQHYASPLGVMPTDQQLVTELADLLGPEQVFAEELHHRGEHSIELVLVWLQYMRELAGVKPCPTLPILVGSFHHLMAGQAPPETDPKFGPFIQYLQGLMQQRRAVIVASGDLAHLGTAFDEPPMSAADYARMKSDDDALLANLCQGDAAGFFSFMQAGQYRRNVCGLSPFYFTLSALGQTRGQTIAYDRCPADASDTSFVSVGGLVWQ